MDVRAKLSLIFDSEGRERWSVSNYIECGCSASDGIGHFVRGALGPGLDYAYTLIRHYRWLDVVEREITSVEKLSSARLFYEQGLNEDYWLGKVWIPCSVHCCYGKMNGGHWSCAFTASSEDEAYARLILYIGDS